MPAKLKELLRKAMGEDEDYTGWVQVAVLTDGEKMAHRTFCRATDKLAQKDSLLTAQHEKINADMQLLHRGFWNRLYERHSLPCGEQYHICRDGRILMKPSGGKE